jgi:CrcB protein
MTTLKPILLVALGGALGSVLRYLLTLAAVSLGASAPVGTFTANALGCLAGGVLLGALPSLRAGDDPWRLLLITGILGGLTTFSALSLETVHLFRDARPALALANITANIAVGLCAVWGGYAIARTFSSMP